MKKGTSYLPLMAMILIAGLAICLLAACTKEEEVYNLTAGMNKSLSVVAYEANWIVNRQVVDQTTIYFERSMSTNDHGNGVIRVGHMPNDILQIKNLLTDELAEPSAEDAFSFESQPFGDYSPYYFYSVDLGFSEKTTYIANKNATENYEAVRYEGYGPGGIALMIDCLTDNKNRTAGFVRSTLTKRNGNLGTDGSVSYMFKRKGLIVIENAYDEEKVMEEVLGLDILDMELDDEITIYTEPDKFLSVKEKLDKLGYDKYIMSEVTFVPDNYISLDEETTEKAMTLIEALEDLDDVQNVYHNLDV